MKSRGSNKLCTRETAHELQAPLRGDIGNLAKKNEDHFVGPNLIDMVDINYLLQTGMRTQSLETQASGDSPSGLTEIHEIGIDMPMTLLN